MGGLPPRISARAGVLAFVVFICLAIPASSRADYRITHGDATITTRCYWVQNSVLHLCEGGEPLALSEIGLIETVDMTALEDELHRDTVRRFFIGSARLTDMESEVAELNEALVEGLVKLEEIARKNEGHKEYKDLRKKLRAEIEDVRQRVLRLRRSWEEISIPERKYTTLKELKSLRFLTWLQSLQEWEIFLETLDPTFRAYATEHARQSAQFGEMYERSALHSVGEPPE